MSTLVTIPSPLPPAPSDGLVYVSDLPFISASNGVDFVVPVQRDRLCNPYGNCMATTLGGRPYAKALGVASVSRVLVHLGGKCTSFAATIGLHTTWVSNSSPVTFSVAGDGVVLYKSTPFQIHTNHTYTPPQNVTVSVAGVKIMALQVSIDDPASLKGGKGDAGPQWANATVLCAEDGVVI